MAGHGTVDGGRPAATRAELVGRGAEVDALLRRLDAAISGRGGLVLLAGEAGIGKTRLADEFATRAAAAGVTVTWGRAWEAGGAPAYWPWIQATRPLLRGADAGELADLLGGGAPRLAQLLPELRDELPDVPEPESASADVARFELFDAVSAFLRRSAERRPLVLIMEDLHAADDSSLLLLRFAAAELHDGRVLLLGTYRDAEVTRDHPLAALLPDLSRGPGTERIDLVGLTRDDVARYIETITGDPPPEALTAAVHRDTNGNPLFVGEVTRLLVSRGETGRERRGLRWPVPEGVREVIGQRLERLSDACRSTLELGSVVGGDFAVDVLERLLDRPATEVLEELDDAVTARLVAPVPDEPGRFRFAHALVRDTVYEELSPAERVRLHRAVGETLEAWYAADRDSHVAELAYHFIEAAPGGDVGTGVDYAVAAGVRAVGLLAYEEAVRLFEMAYRPLRESPAELRRCEVLLLLGDARARAGATSDAKSAFLEAADIATRLADPEMLGRAALGYAGRIPWLRAGSDRQVIPLLTQALDALGEDDSVLTALVLGRLAGALRDQPDQERRARIARRGVEMARRLDDPETLSYALLAEWGATLLGPDRVDEQLAVAAELSRLTEQSQDRERLNDVIWVHFISSMTRGEMWDAHRLAATMDRFAAESRVPSQRWYASVIATVIALHEGRFADAERLVEEASERGRDAQAWDAAAAQFLALFVLRREQGRLAELEPDLRRALVTHPGYRSVRCMILVVLCETGRLGEARALLDQLAHDRFGGFPKDNEWLFALTLLAEAVAALDDRDRAAVLYELLSGYGHLVALAASEVSVGTVERPLGVLAAVLGREDAAAAHFEAAIRRSQRMGSPPWEAHARYAYGRTLVDLGRPRDRRRAERLLEGALATARELGMTVLADRAAAALAQLGAVGAGDGPAAVAAHLDDGPLTPREREVAALVAEGLSNRAVADRLVLSERTVETHVQHILTKLRFTSRTQIVSWALRRAGGGT